MIGIYLVKYICWFFWLFFHVSQQFARSVDLSLVFDIELLRHSMWRCDHLYSGHVFQGVYKEPQMIQIMDRFRAQLGRVSKEIEKRNEKRLNDPDMGFKNIHADPKIVECSVAV